MKEQIEFIKEILRLKEENPNAEIKICVDNEFAEDCGWTSHRIKRVELCSWIVIGEHIYTDEDLAKDDLMDELYISDLSTKDSNSLVDMHFSEGAVEAICVFTEAG
jgi:hypothetical protein